LVAPVAPRTAAEDNFSSLLPRISNTTFHHQDEDPKELIRLGTRRGNFQPGSLGSSASR